MKLVFLLLSGLVLFPAHTGDVKTTSERESVVVTNGIINLEVKSEETIRLANSKNDTVLNISFMGKSGRNRLKASRFSVESDKSSESVITAYADNPEKILATFTMSKGSEYLLIYPGRDTNGTLVEMKSEVSVLPDMLAEDHLYFPDKIKNECRIPTDSYCIMNLLNGGNSMAVCLWTTDDTNAYLGKNTADGKHIDYNFIQTGKHKKLYIGILSEPGIWHIIKEKLNAENFTKINWTAPFEAQWLVTMKLNKGLLMPVNNGNFDTWVIPKRTQDASVVALRLGVSMMKKDIWNAWASLHREFLYPFYIEAGEFFAKHPKARGVSYDTDYPPVVYSYKYEKSFHFKGVAAAKSKLCLPCDKLAKVLPYHEIERLTTVSSPENVYPTTCSVTAEILRYYKDDQATEKRDIIIKQVDRMNKFVDVKDKRYNDYRDWARQEIKAIKAIVAKNDKLKGLAEELMEYLELIENNYEAVREKIKTPEKSAALSAKYIELIDDKALSQEQKEELVDKLGRDIRTMGGSRDNLIAHMRLTVKSIRYHLTDKLTSRLSPEEEELIMRLRKNCGDILWAKHSHEGK